MKIDKKRAIKTEFTIRETKCTKERYFQARDRDKIEGNEKEEKNTGQTKKVTVNSYC